MKKLNNKHQQNGKTQSQRIHFEYHHSEAESVFIAGTFNDWQPYTSPMVRLEEGRWAKDLVLTPGDYEYCLVVNGRWIPDPRAIETAPNPFGGVNSVCRVGTRG